MLVGKWQVYKPDGTYLGKFQTRLGNTVLMLDEETMSQISVGCHLHMDEVYTKRAWEVRVTGYYRGRYTEVTFSKISDRAERYPDKRVTMRVTFRR